MYTSVLDGRRWQFEPFFRTCGLRLEEEWVKPERLGTPFSLGVSRSLIELRLIRV